MKYQAGKCRLLLVVFVLAMLLTILFLLINSNLNTPNKLAEEIIIDFKPGSSIRNLSQQLQEHDLIDQPVVLRLWTRITGDARRLQAGEYAIRPNTTLLDLLDDMTSGRVHQYPLQILEGWTFKEVMKAIRNNSAIDHKLGNLSYSEILQKLDIHHDHPEGLFFPETYHIHKNTSDVELLKRAYSHMHKHLHALWEQRGQGLPFESPYQALILASIVEKESAVPEERTLIAGVFINRLRKNMRLQTDPTVIYGIGDKYDGDIRFRDLRTDTPYNTYTRKGLPPTPIAMPGLGSLQAVMHPAETDYLYFVAFNDNSGRHKFSSTLDEHNKAVDKYQRRK